MLTLKNITKIYKTKHLEKKALNNVSISFRNNEFVSILGQSGSGKTTLLNIIGGLDQYTSGDLIIKGKTTKQFKDRDWDSYRNNTIGFVFQSYNLIAHQSALANVEMAMTLSGLSKKQRRLKAKEVLKRVGLEEHMHKRPSQMSGGQMQRIAIARALVNDPEILLADEPTGALDSQTSIQIMELLKEIANERLVIMVTHNPELAQMYSTRIVQFKDGEILSDSNPFEESAIESEKTFKKTKMRFFTALSLSFNNLLTKKGRTILTAFAGSIGIIGIALILSLSNGVQKYVAKVQEDTLVAYPLSIRKQGSFSIFNAELERESENDKVVEEGKVGVDNQLSTFIANGISNNDLQSFKSYIEMNQSRFAEVTKDIQYDYDITPLIFQNHTNIQVNPSKLAENIKVDNPLVKNIAATSVFNKLSANVDMVNSQYDIIYGKLPTQKDEIVVTVDANNKISDMVLYTLGLKDIETINSGKTVEDQFTYDNVLSTTFKVIENSKMYEKVGNQWIDKSNDKKYIAEKISDSMTLKVVGILKEKSGTSTTSTSQILYTQQLIDDLSLKNEQSDIAKEQLSHQDKNIFINRLFSDAQEEFSSENLSVQDRLALAKMSAEELSEYVRQFNESATATYDDILAKLGVVNFDNPTAIHFYATSFNNKEKLKKLIDEYNSQAEQSKVISYTDEIALLMSSVMTMINMITLVLVGFVAISLVVSSIMISIITYISVLERTKEIGILRALGASKKDVSRIFTAETFIEGALSGVFGIVATILLNIPINQLVQKATKVENISQLPIAASVGLIVLSIILAVIAGIIPSRMAAKKDPVEALRVE